MLKKKTRGPKGPWVAHLRKRSKITVEPIIVNPRDIIWTTLVKDILMMLHIKYESTGPRSFRQEDFWKFNFKTYFFDPVTYLCNQLERFEQFDRGPPTDHSCEVWSKSNKRFQRRCCLKKLLTHTQTTDIEGSQKLTEHFVLRWAKN